MKKLFSLVGAFLLTMSASAVTFVNQNVDVAAGPATGFVQQYGRLKLAGNQLSAENGTAVQLKGFSSFGWQANWGDCWSSNAMSMMVTWGASLYRGAMYVGESGYASGNQSDFTKSTKDRIIECWKSGIYYLCDWHVLTPGNPTDWTYNGATDYFKEISSWAHKNGYSNVIYELCNEPNGVSWDQIKSYAEGILPIIHQNDPGAVVVVGTPQWDQQPEAAANNRISTTDSRWNSLHIMYSFHYYACDHASFLETFDNSCGKIPMFITEWGVAQFTGGAGKREVEDKCYTNAKSLITKADGDNAGGQKVSWALWAMGEKNEQASVVTSCQSMSLSITGNWVVDNIMHGCTDCKVKPTTCYEGTCQQVTKTSASIIDLGRYDSNPEGVAETGKTTVGMSEGVSYHEENTVADEKNTKSNCNGAFMWSEDYSFRMDECVDASGCYGITGAEGWHNLGYIEPAEWEKFTIEVDEPGYYKIELLTNGTTHQTLSITNSTYGYNMLVDYKKSSEDGQTIEEFDDITYDTNLPDKGSDNWKYWEWANPVDNLRDINDIDAALLFTNSGKQTIKVTWMPGLIIDNVNLESDKNFRTAGDAGPLRLTYVKAYNGDPKTVGVKEVAKKQVSIYPNPASDVVYVSEETEKIEVISMGSVVVASANGNSVNIADLANGPYIVKAVLADGSVVTKTIIKK